MQLIGAGPGDQSQDFMQATFALTNGKGTGVVSVPFTDDWAEVLTAAVQARVADMLKVIGG